MYCHHPFRLPLMKQEVNRYHEQCKWSPLYKIRGHEWSGSLNSPFVCLFQLLTAYWWTSKFARDTLTGPAWKTKLKSGQFPHFCMFNGKCRDELFNA